MGTNVLVEKLEKLPEPLQKEVADFVDFLIFKNQSQREKIDGNLSLKYNIEENKLSHNTIIIKEPEFEKPKLKREFGGLEGQIWMSDDFDEPLEDFKDYM